MHQYVCIHGHFYQPPRENPWLEAIEVQDSAAPYHDWNARIAAECYAPNRAARLQDSERKILAITNNYEKMSFDIGPTLLSWLEESDPATYEAIIEADKASCRVNGGHGNAVAQSYNHTILPLTSTRDSATQVRWGVRDFEFRFGRKPEGMWLPECAVSTASLEALAAQGIIFTVLAPYQARRVRRFGSRSWMDAPDGSINTRRPYICQLPSGRTIYLFFYDGPLAQAVAFGGLPRQGEEFLKRIMEGFIRRKTGGQLVHLATDGETYGHHVRFGEMALAYVLKQLSKDPEVTVTNYGSFLERHPPRYEVEIVENSSWSCFHGVERWRNDCGCCLDPSRGWRQQWRRPLREALDVVSAAAAELFEREAKDLLKDPWAARDDYIEVILGRSEESLRKFFERHQARPIGETELTRGLKLLEMQRHAMLMYTSCGWFFDEISGIETVKVLEYAARAIQLAKEFGADWEEGFRRGLEKAPSNVPEFATGAGVYDKMVKPAMIDLPRVVAHHAMSQLFEEPEFERDIYCYSIQEANRGYADEGPARLATGKVQVTSRITGESYRAVYGVVYLGGYDFHCSVAPASSVESYEKLKENLLRRFEREGLTEVIRALDKAFGLDYFTLKDLFIEKRRNILELLTEQVVAKFDHTFRALYEENRRLMTYLKEVNAPLVPGFQQAAAYTLARDISEAVSDLDVPNHADSLETIREEAERWGVSLATEPLRMRLEEALDGALEELEGELNLANLKRPAKVLGLAELLGVEPRIWSIQNRFYRLAHARLPELIERSASEPEAKKLLEAALGLAKRLYFNREALPS